MVGIAPGWWSAVGLALDIAGFLALALELLWEARISSATRNLLLARGHFERLSTEAIIRNEPNDWFHLASKYRSEVGKEVLPRLEAAAKQLKWVGTVPARDEIKTSTMLGNVIEYLASRLDDRMDARFPRLRVPARAGIILVCVGFFLQLVGAIPTCPDASVDWPWTDCPAQVMAVVALPFASTEYTSST